jgi:hypothetical protein
MNHIQWLRLAPCRIPKRVLVRASLGVDEAIEIVMVGHGDQRAGRRSDPTRGSRPLLDVAILFYNASSPESGIDHHGRQIMQLELRQDLWLRAAASVIYDTVYPGPEWAPVSFEQAERLETVHYRQAVAAALLVRPVLADRTEPLSLI